MKLSQKQSVFALNIASLINYIDKSGYSVTFGDAYRSPELARLYAKQGKGIIKSLHCQRLAIDLMLHNKAGDWVTEPSEYKPFGTFWKSLNPANRWGGDFTKRIDAVHFEMQNL